jgi:hypothetical protein
MKNLERGELYRLIALNLAVLLEGAALLSIILRIGLLPIGTVYGNIVSVAVFVLPTVIGLLARRFEAAILLAVLPFWLIAVVYLARYAPPWNVDLFSLGPLAGRVADATLLLGGLGFLGWLLRRALFGAKSTSTPV